jgi:hypothetical protein
VEQGKEKRPVAMRSAIIALGVSLGTLVGGVFRECFHADRGECSATSSTLWLPWLASFIAAWAVIALATWALNVHAEGLKRNK